MSVRGYVSTVREFLRRLVRRSSPVAVIVVIVMMLMLRVLVVDNLGRMALLDLDPEPGGVQYQRDDGDDEENDGVMEHGGFIPVRLIPRRAVPGISNVPRASL